MNEKEWVESVISLVPERMRATDPSLGIDSAKRLTYAHEIRDYEGSEPKTRNSILYETDVLVTEETEENVWKPRVVVEAKLARITTHDAITYSEKASTHKHVHPYLRYGILIGDRKHYPLPGRLFRHGAYFDFMVSWMGLVPTESELDRFVTLILSEVQASRHLEDILYTSRQRGRSKYTLLHKPLVLE